MYSINGMTSSPEEISELFKVEEEATEEKKAPSSQESNHENTHEEEQEQEESTEIDPLDLFKGESERVGNDDIQEREEEDLNPKDKGSSPKIYSSIANSLAEEGALPYLSEEDLKEIKDAESLVEAFKKNNEAQLTETQKRINDALNANIAPSEIQKYEGYINYLNNITEEQLNDESEDGEKIRKALIYQYQIVSGASQERAMKMVERAVSNGTDIEDAKDYLEDLKEHYDTEYKALIKSAQDQVKEAKKKQEEDVKKIKKTILEDKDILGGIEVDAKTRQLAFDKLMRPTHRTDDGNFQSEIQKYISENPVDFQMKVALLFTMTDGFTKMGNVIKQNVKTAKKQALKDLEDVINGSKRTPSGSIDFGSRDEDSSFNTIDIAPPNMWKK